MQTNLLPRLRRAGLLLAGPLFALSSAPIFGQVTVPPSAAFPNFENFIILGGQGDKISGDTAAFQTRDKQPVIGGGGIEDFLLAKDLSKTTSVTLDGHAVGGADDYLGHLNLTKAEVGSLDVGYSTFRTFYDGVGGFFPGDDRFMALANQDLFVDRAKFWAEATVNRPNTPVFNLRFTNEARSGEKDSTIWGNTDFTGLPNNNSPITETRNLTPAIMALDEHHNSLDASMRQTVGRTIYSLEAFGDWTNNLDGLFVDRYPGEVKPFKAPASSVLLNPANDNNAIDETQYNGEKTNTFGLKGTVATEVSDRLTLRAGVNAQAENGTFSGYRELLTVTPVANGPVITPSATIVATPVTQDVITYNDLGLAGTTGVHSFAANVGADFKPLPDFTASLAVKAEEKHSEANGSYEVVAASGTPATTLTTTPRLESEITDEHSYTPALDLRYTGVKNVTFYGTADHTFLDGSLNDTPAYNNTTISSPSVYYNSLSQENSNYKLGANWRESSSLTFRTEVFYKEHRDGTNGSNTNAPPFTATNPADILGNDYLLNSKTFGVKFTAIFKPTPVVTLTSRFIYQHGLMQVTTYEMTAPGTTPVIVYGDVTDDSMHSQTYNIGETVDWTPFKQLYFQVNADMVFNVIDTIYPNAGVVPASGTSVAYDANGVLQNSNNNYFTGSFLAGAVVSAVDDLRAQVTYYRADNSDIQLSNLTLPYGVVATEFSVSLGLKHMFSPTIIGNAKVGYYDSQNGTTGDYTNFHGPLAYVSIEFKL
jgi:hypothetical protein